MNVSFPSFAQGTAGTLLDAENAQKVKAFIEAWNNAKIMPGTVNSVSVTDGNVLISYVPNTTPTPDPTPTPTPEGAAISVAGSDGKLNLVPKHSTWTTPSAYPSELKVVNGSNSITLDSTGFTMSDGSHTITITFAALTSLGHNLTLQSAGYCEGGARSIDVIRSASY